MWTIGAISGAAATGVAAAAAVLLLHEKITRREGLGIAFAITACWLLAG